MATCKSCGAELLWAKTPNGRMMPLDVQPVPDGNIKLLGDGTCEVLTKDDLEHIDEKCDLSGYVPRLHTSHFATCPGASQHRKAR